MAEAKVAPALDTANPTLRFAVTFEFQFRYLVPIRIYGQVRTLTGRILGDLRLLASPENAWRDGILPRSNQNEPQQKRTAVLDCALTPAAIAAILKERETHPTKDIVLNLQMVLVSLQPNFRLSAGGSPPGPADVVFGQQTTWGPGLGEVHGEAFNCSMTIYSSQWSSEYAPAFGVGRFLMLEIPEIPLEGAVAGALADRVRAASVALGKMRIDIEKGEWTQCAEDARPVVELLNNRELLRPLFETNGVQPATAEALLSGLQGVLDYAHAFHHRLDKPREKVVPAVNAEPEDAYLAFATAAALLNLVARKLQKAPPGS
jgi:hypothetical protein